MTSTSPDTNDPLYEEAVAFVRKSGKASISAVQRKFMLGYHVFGFTADESDRYDNIIDSEPELTLDDVLLRYGLTKRACFELFQSSGIALPAMYRLGYHNNNCMGCLKATSAGYWNKVRVDFPKVFATRARQEQLLGVAMVLISEREFQERWPEHYRKMSQDVAAGLVEWKTKVERRGSGTYVRVRVPLRYLPDDAGNHKDLDIGDCGVVCSQGRQPIDYGEQINALRGVA